MRLPGEYCRMFRGSMRGSRDEHRKQRQQKFFYLLSDGTLKKQKVVAKLREIANSIGRERWWRSCLNDAEVLKRN